MQDAAFRRWQNAKRPALTEGLKLSDRSCGFSVATRTGRLALQSAMLALGAFLVLQGGTHTWRNDCGFDPAWACIGAGRTSRRTMAHCRGRARKLGVAGGPLGVAPPEMLRTPLPTPKANLDVQQLTVVPPGEKQAAIRMLSFSVKPGQAIGIIGPSGAGKSTLARALAGVWRPSGGRIRLDHAALDQYDPTSLAATSGICRNRCGSLKERLPRISHGWIRKPTRRKL